MRYEVLFVEYDLVNQYLSNAIIIEWREQEVLYVVPEPNVLFDLLRAYIHC